MTPSAVLAAAGEEVREFTRELMDFREPQRELNRLSPGEEGGVAKL